MRLKCKKSCKALKIKKGKYYTLELYVENMFQDIVYSKEYRIVKNSYYYYTVTDDSESNYYIWKYFYTKEELRIMKIKELLES
jgi:hypothetical protein